MKNFQPSGFRHKRRARVQNVREMNFSGKQRDGKQVSKSKHVGYEGNNGA
jgi:hypothetical protein